MHVWCWRETCTSCTLQMAVAEPFLLQRLTQAGLLQDVIATILAAAQPNAVTGAALRVLQNPRLHTPPQLHANDASADAEMKSKPAVGQAVQQQWQSKQMAPKNADSGNVTASSIDFSSSTADRSQHPASESRQQRGLVSALSKWPQISLTKLHGVSETQAAQGQRSWLGIRYA